jgi:hypothetical protein
MTDQSDRATRAGGKRDVADARSDAHRTPQARDKPADDASTDPQALDPREAQAKARAMSRPPAEG